MLYHHKLTHSGLGLSSILHCPGCYMDRFQNVYVDEPTFKKLKAVVGSAFTQIENNLYLIHRRRYSYGEHDEHVVWRVPVLMACDTIRSSSGFHVHGLVDKAGLRIRIIDVNRLACLAAGSSVRANNIRWFHARSDNALPNELTAVHPSHYNSAKHYVSVPNEVIRKRLGDETNLDDKYPNTNFYPIIGHDELMVSQTGQVVWLADNVVIDKSGKEIRSSTYSLIVPEEDGYVTIPNLSGGVSLRLNPMELSKLASLGLMRFKGFVSKVLGKVSFAGRHTTYRFKPTDSSRVNLEDVVLTFHTNPNGVIKVVDLMNGAYFGCLTERDVANRLRLPRSSIHRLLTHNNKVMGRNEPYRLKSTSCGRIPINDKYKQQVSDFIREDLKSPEITEDLIKFILTNGLCSVMSFDAKGRLMIEYTSVNKGEVIKHLKRCGISSVNDTFRNLKQGRMPSESHHLIVSLMGKKWVWLGGKAVQDLTEFLYKKQSN